MSQDTKRCIEYAARVYYLQEVTLMTKLADQMLEEAKRLSTDERVWLAEELLRSVGTAEQAEIDAAWADEIERRSDALEAGRAELRPADEVMRDMRERLLREK